MPTPTVKIASYESLFGRWSVPRATYVFVDLERLAPWELRVASELHRSMRDAGLRCLNDPAKVLSRGALLVALHAAGENPFAAWRADEVPAPRRFPVFLRCEDNHVKASGDLLYTQQELDKTLAQMTSSGMPLRSMLVIEHCTEPYDTKLWAKWGSWRIGDRIVVEHLAVDDTWLVKTGDHRKQTEAVIADESEGVRSNRFAAELRPRFEIAGIEFGRADHAVVAGKTVVYEINTNPFLSALGPDPHPVRRATRLLARTRIAEALASIDTNEGSAVRIGVSPLRKPIRWWRPGFRTPRRP